ncbi:hypothetical protein PT974_08872 [Cladobotryum mycophilum]|uniref:FAD-binding PCMH-type domain-containing protein n=1 Tax=Cladobotryum mycophilum TaxID=491253 RepID=A0ABR0SEK7_9HYPO
MATPFTSLNLLTSPYTIPNPSAPVQATLSRWSDTHLTHPAIHIVPNTEQDIQSAILFSKENDLHIVPACGGHGTFTPVGPRTAYLDLRNFGSIALDKGSGTEGHYTSVPNSNAVGVVGAILGGGNSSQNGVLGWMADNVLSFRLVTSSGAILEDISPSSPAGDQLALYHALCGAGHGLGIITAVTLTALPLSSLSLTDNKICLQNHQGIHSTHPPANQNDAFEPVNTHGGYKSLAAARLSALHPDSIQEAFARWLSLAESSPDALRTAAFFHNYNPSTSVANGESPQGRARFIDSREKGLSALLTAWCTDPGTQPALSSFLDDILSICRQADTTAGVAPRTFPNNMRLGHGIDQLFPEERLAELARLKKIWDSDGVFWSPYQR